MARPRLTFSNYEARELGESTIRDLWAMRLSHVALRPGVDPEDDYRKWSAYFQGDVRVGIGRDEQGVLQGFYALYVRKRHLAGAPRLLIHTEAMFFNPAYRGTASLRWNGTRGISRAFLRDPFASRIGIALAYPWSVLAVSHFARLRAPRDPNLVGWQREALDEFLREKEGEDYDPELGVVKMRTIPPSELRVPRTERSRRMLRWYEQRNPRWREGYCLPVAAEANVASILRGSLRVLAGR